MLQHRGGRSFRLLQLLDPAFDAGSEDFIASLIVDVAHGHTISAGTPDNLSDLPTAAGSRPLLHKHNPTSRRFP